MQALVPKDSKTYNLVLFLTLHVVIDGSGNRCIHPFCFRSAFSKGSKVNGS